MSLMPSTCWKTEGAILSSSALRLSLSPLFAEIARTMIGTESKLPEITCGFTSEGSKASTALIALLSLSVASEVLVPNSNDTLSTDNPVDEVTLVDSRPSSPITAFSMITETWLSTTSGDAPAYEVTIAADGISIDGISSCFRFPTDSRPNTPIIKVISATTARFASESLEMFDN